ncbi:hypothetical protein FCULG_00005032 [Fusarium culmorum]|uniref:Uncharacterized protein n=1 Tax=Fusarium culmorum TaxID=5516 RepID=A0A2T4H647_FUSCU|nr:hypothetical protein FCULG_00005032 [Fusarium culmorum]
MLAPQPDYVAFHPSAQKKPKDACFHDNSKFLNCIRSGDGEHCEFLRAAQQKATTTCACVMPKGQGGPNRVVNNFSDLIHLRSMNLEDEFAVDCINCLRRSVYEEVVIAERLKVEKRKDAKDDSKRLYEFTTASKPSWQRI